MAQQTFKGTKKKAIQKSGFRKRMKTKSGKRIINRRRMKNRQQLSLN
jgi:large subunit ribosomal protein L34